MKLRTVLLRLGRAAVTVLALLLGLALMPVPPASVSGAAGAGESALIRVGLQYTQTGLSRCTITGASGLALWNPDDRTVLPLPGLSEAVVTLEGGFLRATDASGSDLRVTTGDGAVTAASLLERGYALCSSDYEAKPAGTAQGNSSILRVDGVPYRGGIGFFINANQTFRLINTLTIDEYAYGVINSEMGYSSPKEALKAQAVLVRSYALTNMGRHGAGGYDVCDSTHCQVYKGYGQEHQRSNQAVDETGMLGLYYGNAPAAGYFYKNSGGYTQNAKDVWNSEVAYLKAVKDPHSPAYSWTAEFTPAQLETKLRAAGFVTGEVVSMAITGRNESGAVASLTIRGTQGTAVLNKEKIRSVLGMTQVKSTHFELSGGQARTGSTAAAPASSSAAAALVGEPVWSLLGNLKQVKDAQAFVLGNSGTSARVNLKDQYVVSISGVERLRTDGQNEKGSQTIQEVQLSAGEVFRLEGRGYGHGVGMPQDSAIAMAQAGASFREILQFYFTGIEIR